MPVKTVRRDNYPSAFVEHLEETRPSAMDMVLPDPYSDYELAKSRRAAAAAAAKKTSAPPDVSASGVETNRNATDFSFVKPWNSTDEEAARMRGMREAQRLLMKRRTNDRISVQKSSGQAVLDQRDGHVASVHNKPLFLNDDHYATDERTRQEKLRDYPHARWVSSNSAKIERNALTRSEILQYSRNKKLENMELETYCRTPAALRKTRGHKSLPSTAPQCDSLDDSTYKNALLYSEKECSSDDDDEDKLS